MRYVYRHDSDGDECWVESELTWDAERKCYVVTIRTNDATDANRGYLHAAYVGNPTFRAKL